MEHKFTIEVKITHDGPKSSTTGPQKTKSDSFSQQPQIFNAGNIDPKMLQQALGALSSMFNQKPEKKN